MRHVLRWLLLLVALTIAAAPAACGGDSDDEGRDGDERTMTSGPSREPSGSGDFDDIRSRFSDSKYRATYDFSLVVVERIEGTITWYKDGSARLRFDVTTTQEGQEVTFTILDTPDLSAFCLKGGELGEALGQPADEGLCIAGEEARDENPLGDIADLFSGFDDPAAEVLGTTERQIADVTATCYRVKSPSADAPSETCFSDDGVLLAVSSEGTGQLALEAKEFSEGVSDDDFQPPYEVREFPGAGG